MKNISFLFILAACIFAGACSGSGSSTGTLVGKFSDNVPSDLHIVVGDLDTVVLVKGSKINLSIPAAPNFISYVESDFGRVPFISDGSTLTLDLDSDVPAIISNDKDGVQSRFVEFMDKMQDYGMRASVSREAMEAIMPEYMDFMKNTVKSNPDNALGLYALSEAYYNYEDPQELVNDILAFSSTLRKEPFVEQILAAAQANLLTAVGKPFVDFEVEYNGKTSRFSDYIGRGKYMLVDFWASWCGPCKQEIPNLKEVYDRFHGKDFDILSVAVWDEPQATVDTAKVYNLPWKNHIINAQRIPTDIYGIQGIPHIILFGPDGTILKRGIRGAEIPAEIAKYVKK